MKSIFRTLFLLITKTNDSKAGFRAPQAFRIKTQPEGNGAPLPRAATPIRDAWGAPGGQASGRPFVPLQRLATEVQCALRLTARRLAESCVTVVCLSITLLAGEVSAEVVVQDAVGNTVRLSQPAKRVISLAPHNTENLFAAGAGATLVGATRYSDYPVAAQKVPRVGGYTGLDLETIIALKPDLILAWESGNRKEDIKRLRSLGFIIYLSEPRQLEDIATEIEILGTLTGTTETARQFANRFRKQLQQLRQRYHGVRPVRIFYEIWHRPLITINGEQLISRAISLCGGNNVFAGLSALAPAIDIEAVLAANPDAIITSARGAQQDREWLENWRRWPQLRAVAQDNLYFIPPDLLQRQGPRILQGTEQLCETIARARNKLQHQ